LAPNPKGATPRTRTQKKPRPGTQSAAKNKDPWCNQDSEMLGGASKTPAAQSAPPV
jgi:hypothetical protein